MLYREAVPTFQVKSPSPKSITDTGSISASMFDLPILGLIFGGSSGEGKTMINVH
jgi:hypothetical protein